MIPQETKAKIFALYWGQKVLVVTNVPEKQTVGRSGWNLAHPDFYLALKPLSAISDEDAKEIGKILEYRKDEMLLIGRSVAIGFEHNFVEKGCNVLEVADFLRSRGYALPAYGYSVDDLVNEGVFKLTDKN